MAFNRYKARDAAKHPTMHRTAPTTKKVIWPPNINIAKAEKTCFSVLYLPLLIALPSWGFFFNYYLQ